VIDDSNAKLRRRKEKIFALLLCSALLVVAGCNQKSDADRAKLDSFLSGTLVDRIDIVSWAAKTNGLTFRTNTLSGPEAIKFVISLMETNRIDGPDLTKAQLDEQVYLMHGTNALCCVDLYENGLWRFGDYSFRVRSAP
jgi:hypothetical protein